jgi:GT2 family glycosyltransferase
MLGQGPSHPYYLHEEKSEVGLIGNAVSAHEASAVTGACMMVRKEDYQAVGGFDPAFRINYNDVDFCMRLRAETGKRIVWTPHARIYHYESVSREEPPKGELEALEKRWGFGADIYYNRHLSQFSNSYEIGLDVASINDDYEIEAACL